MGLGGSGGIEASTASARFAQRARSAERTRDVEDGRDDADPAVSEFPPEGESIARWSDPELARQRRPA